MTEAVALDQEVQEEVRNEVRRARRQDRLVLTSWGLAILIMAGLGSFWIWSNERRQSERDAAALKAQQVAAAQLQLEQDRAMCAILQILMTGPDPVAGPAGDRGRAVLKAMTDYQKTLGCDLPRVPAVPR